MERTFQPLFDGRLNGYRFGSYQSNH